jgi:DNA-binding Lrp family transcriptional regulator
LTPEISGCKAADFFLWGACQSKEAGILCAHMADDFLGDFMDSNARAKVLRVFAFDPGVFTATQVAKRSGVSERVATQEIEVLEERGIIKKGKFVITVGGAFKTITGKQKEPAWTMNQAFKYASAISKFIHEVSPVHHKNIVTGLRRAGRISAVVLSGAFVGDASRPADLVIVGDGINESRLESAVKALEPQVGREIRYAAFSTPEFRYRMTIEDRLLRDTLDFPHLVLLDKTRLL